MSHSGHRYSRYSQSKVNSSSLNSKEASSWSSQDEGFLDASSFEYNASEVRMILQELFPSRKLVLSQFTFFNQSGVGKPSGTTTRRGRRCYRLPDLLPIATILALKEQGIPNKNVDKAPPLVQDNADLIFSTEGPCQLSGVGDLVHLSLPKQKTLNIVSSSRVSNLDVSNSSSHDLDRRLDGGVDRGLDEGVDLAIIAFLDNDTSDFFWSYDVGFLALELVRVTNRLLREGKFTSTENKSTENKSVLVNELRALNKRAVA